MRFQAKEISERLAERAEQVAGLLWPNGKRNGGYWQVGSVSGESGKSLRVYLRGDRAGSWKDYATGEGGDILDAWAAVNRQSIPEAMTDAAEWLGMKAEPFREPTKQYRAPEKKFGTLKPEHLNWFGGRCFEQSTIDAYGLGSDGGWIAFPYYRDGKLARVKYRTMDKKFRQEPGCINCLFGWQAIPDKARSVAIVEGEADCMALHQYGMPALSIPDGGGGHGKQGHWIEIEYDRLNRFDTIFLALDNDDDGEAARDEILERLGERCRVVTLPHKDANACLMQGISRDELRECFRKSTTVDPEELKPAEHFRAEFHAEFERGDDSQIGFGPPFESIRDELRFRPGELIIVAGRNGEGKSQFCGHLMLEAMRFDFRTCIASMEFKPSRYLQRMGRQAGASNDLTREYRDAIVDWWNERLWVFDLVGTAKRERMIEVFRYARRRYGIRVFLIDNLAKCGIPEDDYNAQKDFVDQLGDFAKYHDAIVFLVHHMRKAGEGKLAVKGTGAITDMADTVLLVHRNKEKEEEIRKLVAKCKKDNSNLADNEEYQQAIKEQDGVIRCEKQRNGDSEPVKLIWFDKRTFQFLSGPDSKPWRYVGWSKHQHSEVAA